jgi:D-serine deaminase-like pyridoxal phosphate-dependent protein
VTVATVREAIALVDRRIGDVLIANEVVGENNARAVAALTRRCELPLPWTTVTKST